MNICVECKHCKGGEPLYPVPMQNDQFQCMHPNAASRDMVTGKAFCLTERNTEDKNACGKTGKLWEKK